MDARGYQTFKISSPVSTHTRPGSCEEAECQMYAQGWKMKLDLTTELGQKQAYYIKHHSGRSYKVIEQRDGLATLEFSSGQPCFQQHRVAIGRPEIFSIVGGVGGDNPLKTPTRVHKKAEFWVEEFATNQDRIADARKKGSYE